MKKFARALVAVSLIFSLNGCAAWWEAFKNDPITQIQFVLDRAESVKSFADLAFSSIKLMLPVEKRDAAQKVYDKAVLVLNQSIAATRAALETAAQLKQDKPDLSKVIAELSKAANAVMTVIDGFRQAPGVMGSSDEPKFAESDIIGYQDMRDQIVGLNQNID